MRPASLLLPRLIGALSCSASTYRDVARDPYAGLQAGIIVVLAGVIEASVDAAVHGHPQVDALLLATGVVAAVIGWLLWSAILWIAGARMLGHDAEFLMALRGVAFAHATSLPYGLGVIPVLTPWTGLLRVATLLWFVLALYAATRGIFDLDHRQALQVFGVAVVGRILAELLPYAIRLVPG
jgi:hypothetical protein